MDDYRNKKRQKMRARRRRAQRIKMTGMCIAEYSRAVTPQIRQAGNRLSGLAETAYASLLA